MSTGTLLMDAYLAGLEPHERLLIQQVFTPFAFTAGSIERLKEENAHLIRREVTVYSKTLVISGRNEQELDDREATVRNLSLEIIQQITTSGFDGDGEGRENCPLPTITDVCARHAQYPVFGIIIGVHDLRCDDCPPGHTEAEREVLTLLDKEEVPLDEIIPLSDGDQQVLVDLAGSFLTRLFRQLLPSERLSLCTDEPVMLAEALYELDWVPALAGAFNEASFLWMVSHPYLFHDLFEYVWICDELRSVLWHFERALTRELPFDIRQEYAESASMLRGDDVGEFFALTQ